MAMFANWFGARSRKARAASATTNLAGGEAHRLTPRLEAATLVLSSMLQDRFYAPGSQDAIRVKTLVASLAQAGDAQFAAKTAIYARHQHGLRSITHVVAGEVGRVCQGQPWGKRFFERIVRRPDDASEIVGYTLASYGGVLPNAMKRGIAKALVRFDAHQIAKYRGAGRAVKLVDVVNLCHPKGGGGSALAALVKGTVGPADTWERALTSAGTQAKAETETVEAAADRAAELKSAAWARLLAERKLGYRTVDVTSSVLGIAQEIKSQAKSAGTNFHAIFEAAGKRRYDRVVILSDMQGWMGVGTPDGAFATWKARSGCDPYVYAFDLNGHGTAQLIGDKVCTVAGWSDKVFDVMRMVEQDREALVAAIDAVEL